MQPSTARVPGIKGPTPSELKLSARERRNLLALFDSLTDEAVLHDARLSDPWLDTADLIAPVDQADRACPPGHLRQQGAGMKRRLS